MQDDHATEGLHRTRARGAWIALALSLATGAAQATSCEKVMAPIEASIRAKGVTDFHLEAVDRAASAPGRQVGTCDLGRKKILYLRDAPRATGNPGAATAAAVPASGRTSGTRVITECADGRVIEQGSCAKK